MYQLHEHLKRDEYKTQHFRTTEHHKRRELDGDRQSIAMLFCSVGMEMTLANTLNVDCGSCLSRSMAVNDIKSNIKDLI